MRSERGLDRTQLTRFLQNLKHGNGEAHATLMPAVYSELRSIARALLARSSGALQPTELVNEAFLRLFEPDQLDLNDRNHFFALAARSMRQILVDDARARASLKRGGGADQELLDDAVALAASADVNVLDLDEALTDLAGLAERQARVVELRFFGGFEMEAIANVLGVSTPTVERDWYAARAWLGRRLGLATE